MDVRDIVRENMDEDLKRLSDSLQNIKDECGKYEDCEDCPLHGKYNDDIYCKIFEAEIKPRNWNVVPRIIKTIL